MGKYTITRAFQNGKKYDNDVSDVLPTRSDFDSEYEYNNAMKDFPYLGRLYGARNEKLEYEENKQWWSDYARHTGIDLSKIRYPIRMGLYRNGGNPLGEAFEATEAIMSLYSILR